MKRVRIDIFGLVQGVGFRPHLHNLAVSENLSGFVCNTMQGVQAEAEGLPQNLERFIGRLNQSIPVASRIDAMNFLDIPPLGETFFRIRDNQHCGPAKLSLPHDRAPCVECLSEMNNPRNPRFQYPFITCNDCGPRFTIIHTLPFERNHTAMGAFKICMRCQQEYLDPTNRRFHCQTISCPECGPKLKHQHNDGSHVDDSLTTATSLLKRGGILALKGVGGFQLVCSARFSSTIDRIRRFKARPKKPLALMAPNIDEIARLCTLSKSERDSLKSAASPIVLLYVEDTESFHREISSLVAPGLETIGVMLPSSPLHEMITSKTREWLVVTSANRRGEPTITDDCVALSELADLADGFLIHDREILHVADDSVVRLAGNRRIVLRHARGLAPSEYPRKTNVQFLDGIGVGGHAKSAFAFAAGDRYILGQHIGDLDNRKSLDRFSAELRALQRIYHLEETSPIIAQDAHPNYGSSDIAEGLNGESFKVFHHEAHLESLIIESGISGRGLGVVCDGSGLGADGSIWGGEFFLIDGDKHRRIASLLPFHLPGGEKAVREPRRAALGLMLATYGPQISKDPLLAEMFQDVDLNLLVDASQQGINSPMTSSLGRLFDGIAALLGVCSTSAYEAQAPMALEALAHNSKTADALPLIWTEDAEGLRRWDWRNLVVAARELAYHPDKRGEFSFAFHATIANAIFELATEFDTKSVLLTGGVFQNAILVNLLTTMANRKIRVITHQTVPPGDGGLALGQIGLASKGV